MVSVFDNLICCFSGSQVDDLRARKRRQGIKRNLGIGNLAVTAVIQEQAEGDSRC